MPANYPTLMDVARRSGDKGIEAVVEVLNQTNAALDDIPWLECNSGVMHVTTVRTGLPTATWRMLNSGVPVGKSATKQIKAGCGMLETYAEVDDKIVQLSKNPSAFIASENAAFIEGMGQEVGRVMFYGDPANPKEPVGLINYYNDGSANAETRKNILDGGGESTDNSSIWLICWGDKTVHGLYPQGSKAGLTETYKGVQTVKDTLGGQFEARRTHYSWDSGFVVRDWRYAVRIANISAAALDGSSAPALIKLMIKALNLLPTATAGTRMAFYARREVVSALDIQTLEKSNLALAYGDAYGRKVLQFRGVPVRQCDALLTTEDPVELS